MPAGVDLIFFDNSDDWQVVANATRTAQQVGRQSHVPIPAFTLGLSLKTDYVAVVASTASSKPTWQFAGDIDQVYNFAPGGTNPITGKIQPVRTRIFLNKLTLIETNRVSTDTFDLRYQPPYWFKDCAIRVYQYTGDKLNFVEDTLFDIGNALGIDPNRSDGRIIEALLALKLDIENRFTELNDILDDDAGATEEAQQQLIIEVEQLKAGVYTAVEAIAEVIPPDRRDNYRQMAQQRLDLDLGFL